VDSIKPHNVVWRFSFFFLFCFATVTVHSQATNDIIPVVRENLTDKKASDKTAILYYNLKKLSEQYILFGQQDYASDGQGWKNEHGRCDVKEVTGSYPALYSFDFLHFTNGPTFETKHTDYLAQLMHEAYNRGGVISFCWHYRNPVTGGSFYDTSVVVKHILPGGSHNAKFKSDLKIIADFANAAKDANGNLIPIIFRPWHEFDGQWFWWGKPHCTADEFKSLYRFTVTYLRDSLHVHNFIYAFSPDCRFETEDQYLERYPGNEYVDIVGMDNYWDFNPKGGGMDAVMLKTRIISDYAKKSNKIAAITETGLANLTDSSWYTQKLLKAIKQPNIQLAYVAVWRGEYVPYPGHPAVADFMNFRNDSKILFENDLPKMYQLGNIEVKKLKQNKK
jgi:mannan endo-1,4-beta-mannosidase